MSDDFFLGFTTNAEKNSKPAWHADVTSKKKKKRGLGKSKKENATTTQTATTEETNGTENGTATPQKSNKKRKMSDKTEATKPLPKILNKNKSTDPEAESASNAVISKTLLASEESADDRRLRIAKEHLERMKAMKDDDEQASDDESEVIAKKLEKEALRALGASKVHLAERLREHTFGPSDVKVLKGHRLTATAVALVDDGSSMPRYAYTSSKDGTIVKWDLEEAKKVYTINCKTGKNANSDGHTGEVLCLAASSDGQFVVSGGSDKTVRVWDGTTGNFLSVFKGHRGPVQAAAFQQGTRQLFTGSTDRTVKVWNLDELAYMDTLYGHQSDITAMDSYIRERCISVSSDKSTRVWKLSEESQLVFNDGHTLPIDCVTLLTDDSFVTGSQDGSLSLWNTSLKRPLGGVPRPHPDGPANWISALSCVRHSDLVASGSTDGTVKLWQCQGENTKGPKMTSVGTIPLTLPESGKGLPIVNGLAFSRSGQLLVAALGQEPRLGRWYKVKNAVNGLAIIQIPSKTKNKS